MRPASIRRPHFDSAISAPIGLRSATIRWTVGAPRADDAQQGGCMFYKQQKPSRGAVVAALAVACALGAASFATAAGRTPTAAKTGRTPVNQVKITGDGTRVFVDLATG